MFTGINESNTLTKHILCECKYRFDGNKYNSDQWWNNNKYQCKCKKRHICVKGYIWNRSTCNCKHGKYLAIIIDDAVFTCDEVIGSCDEETKNIYILLVFLLITIMLLIAVSIYSYLIKYQTK